MMSGRTAWPWMLAPAIVAIGFLFAGGLLFSFAESITGSNGEWTLARYRELISDQEFLVSLGLTLMVSLTAAVLSAIAGLSLALALRPAVRQRPALTALLQVPVAVPHLSMALVLINLASPSGLLARVGHAAGWISTPAHFPPLLNHAYVLGIIL